MSWTHAQDNQPYMFSLRPLLSSPRILPRASRFRTLYRAYTMAAGKSPQAPIRSRALHSPPSTPQSKAIDQQAAPSDNRPVVISGPSGVGKGTLYKLLLERRPNTFATSVSHTTRDPRPGETRDVDYYYITMEEFEKMIEEEKFVEVLHPPSRTHFSPYQRRSEGWMRRVVYYGANIMVAC
jgi:hypothetical protein